MALLPVAVFSAGLGKLNVSSGLGEPLRADIELLSVTPEELNSIFAAIASEEAYAIQGIERPASHNSIKVEVAKNASGTPILKLKSTQPISEPFLDMLIQVDWASGRLLREYTVLLDPPGYTGESEVNTQNTPVLPGQTAQLPAPRSTNAAPDKQAPSASTENKKANRNNATKQAKAIQPAVSDSSTDLTGSEYVTQRGDSLAKIAQNLKPEGVSLDQMLVGLYQANPSAFDGKNMNRLKVGKIIRPPTDEVLAALSRQQASKEVKVQSANWNTYRNKLAGIVADSTPIESEPSAQSANGKIKSAAEDQSAPPAAGPKDVVKLSAGESASTKKEAKDVQSLQANIAALQEESTAREKSVKEAQDKTVALEKQIEDMQRLLILKNGAMSDMQKQAEMQASGLASQSAQAQSELPAVSNETASPADATSAEPAQNEQQAPVVQSAPEQKPSPAPVVVTEPAAAPGMLDNLDLPLLGAGAGLLALLAGGWFYLRNKRKRNLADFEQGIMTSGGLKANTVFGNTSGSSVDTGDTSFLTDFSQSANGGMIDTNDVDPIAEAEVYMAYGRDAQAEEILKDAISKEPKRYELHLKLLEMYAASKNVSAFETIAGELYTTLGAEDSTWIKVAEIGHKLEPSNPLYIASPVHSVSTEKLEANDFSDSPIANETDLDFSFDNNSMAQNLASSSSEKDAFDLDLDALNANTDSQFEQFKLNNDSLDEANFSTNPTVNFEQIQQNNVEHEQVFATEDSAEKTLSTEQLSAEQKLGAGQNLGAEESNDGLDFDFGELTANADQAKLQDEASFGHTMPGLNFSAYNMPQSAPELTMDFTELKADEPVTFAVDTAFAQSSETANTFELPALDEPVIAADALSDATEFNFDLSTISPEASSYVDDVPPVITYDLTSISLEMPDDNFQNDAKSLPVDEPVAIETKLDLVAAYMEMGDAEGAKELLDEVLKEGSTNQRKRAEALFAKLS